MVPSSLKRIAKSSREGSPGWVWIWVCLDTKSINVKSFLWEVRLLDLCCCKLLEISGEEGKIIAAANGKSQMFLSRMV